MGTLYHHATVNNLHEYGEDVIDKLFAERAIYVVSPEAGYCPGFLQEGYDFEPAGSIWRVVRKRIEDSSD